MPKNEYYKFEISIVGHTKKLEDIHILHSNLDTEIAGFEHCLLSLPTITIVDLEF